MPGVSTVTTLEFIRRAREIHRDKYIYDKVEYINCKTKVTIICPTHGEFFQCSNKHISARQGCPYCRRNRRISKEEFISMAIDVHNGFYDYSVVQYTHYTNKVTILCPEHGPFDQTPQKHILREHGCPSCSQNRRLTTAQFIDRSRKIHGNKYGYDKVIYSNNSTPVIITCFKHGDFSQVPTSHIDQCTGCPSCKHKTESMLSEYLNRHFAITCQFRLNILPSRKFDIYIPSNNTIIELDGPQHFIQISNWKSFRQTQVVDVIKMYFALKSGISIIRVSQQYLIDNTQTILPQLVHSIVDTERGKLTFFPTNGYGNHIHLLEKCNHIIRALSSDEHTPYEDNLGFIIDKLSLRKERRLIRKNEGNICNLRKLLSSIYPHIECVFQTLSTFLDEHLGATHSIEETDEYALISFNTEESLYHTILKNLFPNEGIPTSTSTV